MLKKIIITLAHRRGINKSIFLSLKRTFLAPLELYYAPTCGGENPLLGTTVLDEEKLHIIRSF